MKLLFFDLETTGVKFWRNGIHQIGGIVDIDGQEAERFDIRLAPNPAATIEQEALDVAGVTLEQIQSYQPMEDGYRQLVGILSKYVNKFDMENFKLMTVAKTMGIEIDENKLHDATYDIELTRDIFYRIIGKMDVKL